MKEKSGRSNFLEWLVELLLVLTLLPALLSPAVLLVLLRPAVYRQAIAAQKLDERFAGVLAEWLTRSRDGGEGNDLQTGLSHLNQEQLVGELAAVLPKGWAEEQANQLVERLLSTLNLRSDTFELPIDLGPLKQAVVSNESRMANVIVASWPECSTQDLLRLGVMALTGDITDVPYCQPPQAFQPLVTGFVEGLLRLAVGSLPDRLDLVLLLPGQMPEHWLGVYRLFRISLNIAPWAAVVLAMLAFAICWPNRILAAQMIGRSLVTASVLLALLLLVGYLLATRLLPELASGWLSLLPTSITSTTAEIIQLVGLRYVVSRLVWLLMASSVGFVLLRAPRRLARSNRT